MLRALPEQQRCCPRNTAKGKFDKAVQKKFTVSMWCTDHGCRFQESPTHPCLGNFKMFQCVLSTHTRAQFCRGCLVYHMIWQEEHLVPPNFESATVVSGDQVLVAGMVISVFVLQESALSRSLGSCPSWQHLLGASAPFQPYKWSWSRCWSDRCHDHGLETKAPKVWNVPVSLQRDY